MYLAEMLQIYVVCVEQNFTSHRHFLQEAQKDDVNTPSSCLVFLVRILSMPGEMIRDTHCNVR